MSSRISRRPPLRPKARALAPELYAAWREAGAVVAVRVNPLELDGMDDLAAVMRGRPDIVALPKVAEPSHVARLDEAVTRFERDYGIPEGATALLPNIEFARGLVQLDAIARASRAHRAPACWRPKTLPPISARSARPTASSSPIAGSASWSNASPPAWSRSTVPIPGAMLEGVERDTRWARRLGYGAKKPGRSRRMRRSSIGC